MNFTFNTTTSIRDLLGEDITAWTAQSLRRYGKSSRSSSSSSSSSSPFSPFHSSSSPQQQQPTPQGSYQQIATIINSMGQASAAAQGLGAVITNTERMSNNPDHVLFIAANKTAALGIIKLGSKKLFHRSSNGGVHEITPLCVLDFYVNERCQRQGVGHALFTYALHYFQVQPYQLGYDRPSTKFLSFLNKHYKLSHYEPQNNNFVVYSDYFEKAERTKNNNNGRGKRNTLGNTGQRIMACGTTPNKTAQTKVQQGQGQQASHYSTWFEEQNQSATDVSSSTLGIENQLLEESKEEGARRFYDSLEGRGQGHPELDYLKKKIRKDTGVTSFYDQGNQGSTRPQQQGQQGQQRQQGQQGHPQGELESPYRNPVVASRNYFASHAANSNSGAFSRLAARTTNPQQQFKNSSTNLW